MEDFNIRKFLTENKLTINTKILKESDESEDVKSTEGGSLRDQFLAVGTSEEVSQYLESLKNDLKLNGPEGYEGWTKSDYVEDFRNYLEDKTLEEGIYDLTSFHGVTSNEPKMSDMSEPELRNYIEKEEASGRLWGRSLGIAQHMLQKMQKDKVEENTGYAVGNISDKNPIIKGVKKGINAVGNAAKKFNKFMEPYGKAAAQAMREGNEDWDGEEFQIPGEGDKDSDDYLPSHDEFMEGQVNMRELKLLQDMLRIVGSDWMHEGFDKEDIKEYINRYIVENEDVELINLEEIINKEKNNNNPTVTAVTLSDKEYEQTFYIKNITNKEELKKLSLSKTTLQPKKIKYMKLGKFSDLDEYEKEQFEGDIAIFEPESLNENTKPLKLKEGRELDIEDTDNESFTSTILILSNGETVEVDPFELFENALENADPELFDKWENEIRPLFQDLL